ncbi:Oligopeptide transport ATP-binding protein OppF [Neomoorella glycerini]|uniref:Oligopeptide transport ATP-binding protein OppF n=1 Tax=Neomoorella glycerini TaxID=55779 RepID=A0A6I5ZVM0_9FIRM|nr:ABC transporter ATP-binding protein [Moorella glycerini]QGP93846.1 Oligopeptide transport ATP-binding protein OppF [Moorella glycerini]
MIRVENLTRTYWVGTFKKKPLQAVDNVTFFIRPGETLGLVGESGCGKSTLARLILGLIPPTSGKVFFDDLDLTAIGPREILAIRKKMQIIFQHPESALNPRMRIFDCLAEPLRLHRIVIKGSLEEKERVAELVELVGLSKEHLNRFPHELSGGQLQRVVLARALSLHPSFIVADEPTSMLDVSVQAQVLNLLKHVQGLYNLTYLFISHDIEVVHCMSNRIAVMYGGKIVEIGPADSVYKNPLHPYTQLLIRAFSDIGASILEPGTRRFIKTFFGGCRFYPSCPQAGNICKNPPELKEVAPGHSVACLQI